MMQAPSTAATPLRNILDVLAASGGHTTLLTALRAAGLADTLRLPGPFTLFAPDDEAFGRLPPGRFEDLLKHVRHLKSVLVYHVVSGRLAADDILPGALRTVEGRSLDVVLDSETIRVDGATIATRDVPASNGVIHRVDAVLFPRTSLRVVA